MSVAAPPPPPPTHRWTYDVRRWVVIGLVVAGSIFAYFIRDTIPALALALLLAYLLNPIVTFLTQRLKIPRIAVAGLTYVVLIAILIESTILVTPNIARQIGGLAQDFDVVVGKALDLGKQIPIVSNWANSVDAAQVTAQLENEARGLLEQIPSFAAGAASRVLDVFLVLVLSFYLVKDADKFVPQIRARLPEAYRGDMDIIVADLDRVWSGFLRGQVLLALIIGGVTTVALLILGVKNWLLLGILAGLLEVVPTIGPIIAMVPAVFVALFQGSTNWPLDPVAFAVIVVITYFGIQQLEGQVVVPTVLGASVDLPPVLILAGTIVGASLGGVLGIFLAAPLLATARLFFGYVAKKLFEPLPDTKQIESI